MNATENIVVSVIVPTFNRLERLQRTVAGIESTDFDHSTVEILIIDNSSTDGTKEWATERAHGGFTYIRKAPEGPSIARNRGLQEARGEFALIMDSDVELCKNWLRIAVDAMRSDPSLGCVGGKILYSHKPAYVNAYGGVLSPVGIAWDAHEGVPDENLAEPESCLWINCSAMLTRLDLARRAGCFDSSFFFGYEDSDYGWRVNLLGYKCSVLPNLKALHYIGSHVSPGNAGFTFEYSKNRLRSLLKNYSGLNLLWVIPSYLTFTCADIAVRPDKRAKARAVFWNIARLRETWKERRRVQRLRTVRDSDLAPLFASRWFPEVWLDGRRRRPDDHLDTTNTTAAERTSRPDFWT